MAGAETPAGKAKLPLGVKFAYGIGGVGESAWVTSAAFLFFYYTAVLGLSGSLVGAALFIGLCADAVVDPFFGSWSDNIRSRFGRRVPLMLVGAPLFGLAVGFLFMPPEGLSEPLLFVWLAAWAVAVRTFLSMFHVPFVALGAEMSSDYDERSSVVAWRTVFAILAGVVVTAMAYSVFFAGEGGLQKPERYPGFGWAVALLVFAPNFLSAILVARYAGKLPGSPQASQHLLRRLPGEVVEIFRNPSFRLLFLAAAITYAAVGVNAAFNSHVYVFVWKLRPEMIQTITYAFLAGLMGGVALAPHLARRLEKKTVVVLGMGLVVATWLALSVPRIAGVVNASGSGAVTMLACLIIFAGIGAGFCAIAYPSMMADAADEHEHLFGRRREGLYFAGLGFAFKGANGIGVLIAGFALDLIGFPKDVGRQVGVDLPEPLLRDLLIAWGLAAAALTSVGIVIIAGYSISKRRHGEIAQALRISRAQPAE